MTSRTILCCVLLVGGLFATGCDGGTGDGDGRAESVSMEAQDNVFEPDEVEVPAGDVEITVDNTGEAEHNLTIEEFGVDEDVHSGEQITASLTAEPGTYDMVCSYHEAVGMVGTLTVTE